MKLYLMYRAKKAPVNEDGGFLKNRRYLLSRFWHYHRLVALNYCVRDGNRCDHYDIAAGRRARNLSTARTYLVL